MKLIVSALVLFVATFFIFQNCNKRQSATSVDASATQAQTSIEKIDLKDVNVESITFYINDSKIITNANYSYQVKYNKILQINLQSGRLEEKSDLDNKVAEYCLTNVLKAEVVSLLSKAQVCKYQRPSDPNTMCAQAIRQAYADIITAQQTYNIGSASDGCETNSVDLCDEQLRENLKTYISDLNKNYKSMNCR